MRVVHSGGWKRRVVHSVTINEVTGYTSLCQNASTSWHLHEPLSKRQHFLTPAWAFVKTPALLDTCMSLCQNASSSWHLHEPLSKCQQFLTPAWAFVKTPAVLDTWMSFCQNASSYWHLSEPLSKCQQFLTLASASVKMPAVIDTCLSLCQNASSSWHLHQPLSKCQQLLTFVWASVKMPAVLDTCISLCQNASSYWHLSEPLSKCQQFLSPGATLLTCSATLGSFRLKQWLCSTVLSTNVRTTESVCVFYFFPYMLNVWTELMELPCCWQLLTTKQVRWSIVGILTIFGGNQNGSEHEISTRSQASALRAQWINTSACGRGTQVRSQPLFTAFLTRRFQNTQACSLLFQFPPGIYQNSSYASPYLVILVVYNSNSSLCQRTPRSAHETLEQLGLQDAGAFQ